MQPVRSLQDIKSVILILVFLMVVLIFLSPPQDADMWWHLSAGKKMVEQREILTTDTFSYTHRGDAWTNAFWLSDIIFFLVYGFSGFLGIALLVAFIAVMTMVIIYRQPEDGAFPIPHLVVLLGAFAIAPVWTARPQIFSFLLLAVLDYGLNGRNAFVLRHPWILVGLFILWGNIHGGFIWGFLLLLAFLIGKGLDYALGRENRLSFRALGQLAAWIFFAALAVSINPNGLGLWKLPFYTVDVSIQAISEWGSPDFHRPDLHPVLWLLFIIMAGIGTNKRALSWSRVLTVIGFAYMAFISQRSIGPLIVVASPVGIGILSSLWEELSPIAPRLLKSTPQRAWAPGFSLALNILLVGTMAGIAVLRANAVSALPQVHHGFPRGAVEAVRAAQPKPQMFNSYNWGGYLQWQLPEYPVFIDGRTDLYGELTIQDWWSVVNGTEQGLSLLDSWNVNFVILEPGWPILEMLSRRGWQTLYQDDTAVVLVR